MTVRVLDVKLLSIMTLAGMARTVPVGALWAQNDRYTAEKFAWKLHVAKDGSDQDSSEELSSRLYRALTAIEAAVE